jgi:hypothetical protein
MVAASARSLHSSSTSSHTGPHARCWSALLSRNVMLPGTGSPPIEWSAHNRGSVNRRHLQWRPPSPTRIVLGIGDHPRPIPVGAFCGRTSRVPSVRPGVRTLRPFSHCWRPGSRSQGAKNCTLLSNADIVVRNAVQRGSIQACKP